MATVTAFAPGRVNLIGDHTDYTGGLVLPMAIDMGTTVTGERGGGRVVLDSDAGAVGEPRIEFAVPVGAALGQEGWGRYAEAVAAELGVTEGLVGRVTSDLPIGAGLSSSASLELAVALALGFEGPARELAGICQRAEQAASGVPCGIMDQLASAAGAAGCALLIDCRTLVIDEVPFPDDVQVVVVHSGQVRRLAASAYADRRRQCEEAEALIGPLRDADPGLVETIADPLVRARARHVVSENDRVARFATALTAGDPVTAGQLMLESHRSLAGDFDVSTDALDALVAGLTDRPGVWGARLTGAGFGGCVVALARPGAIDTGWPVRPAGGATVYL
ncbi:MAG TPA: galactokinase family protein [Acidimicrobiales bacterium]|jgi:galactokinase|nr:galactokinase family protein [Acidimicrobiales bacterium]